MMELFDLASSATTIAAKGNRPLRRGLIECVIMLASAKSNEATRFLFWISNH